ncbi:MAG: HlyD family efflux transporter periplasmic adaptor subunit [Lachnospiraceae bacterium]|nr:HlyD family efflux transporter periplasmic adaptor subunit [Lachnospiraceae bacterium]
MKPIIVDMKDMSDSTEVYEARPNPVLSGFIYLILAMIIVAFIWMGFFTMDIVVKATGTVAAADEVATVTNQVSGTITGRMIEDGQTVKKGDVLYTISHEAQSLQLESLKKQLADNDEKEEMLKVYQAWLQDGEEFPVSASDNLYYSEVTTRKMLVELKEESTKQIYSEQLLAYETKLNANETMADYYKEAINKSRQLIEAIKNRNNSFGEAESYYRNYMDNYLAQYQNIIIQYDSKTKAWRDESTASGNRIHTLETEMQALQTKLEGARQPILTVSVEETIPEQEPIVGEAVDTASVDDSADAPVIDEDLQATVTGLEQQIHSLEAQISVEKSAKAVLDSNINDYNIQKSSALISYEKESIASVENSILAYEQNLAVCEGTELEYTNGKNNLKDQGFSLEIENFVTQEKYSVAEELETCRQSRAQLLQQIEGLQQSVENATVKATMDGTINLATDLVEGDYLTAGAQVLSIIPQTEAGSFMVRSYVKNTDIAKVHEGMEVTYEVGAYPSREYGTMRGEVTFVSADLKVNDSGSAYYVVETSVNPGELCNRMGEEVTLRVGMLCETKVVIETKSVLEVLIDKMFRQ